MKNGKLRNWDRLFNQSAAHDVFNYLRVPDKEWNSKLITVSNTDDNLHVNAHKQSVCCTILLLTLKSSQVAGTEYNWCAALQTLSRLGCSDFLTWNSNSRGCFWWWKRPWTWKTPFRRYNGTHHPTQTLGAEAGRDLHRQSCGRFSANLSKRILCREHGFSPLKFFTVTYFGFYFSVGKMQSFASMEIPWSHI